MSRVKSTAIIAAVLLLAVAATAASSPQSLPATGDWLDGSDDTPESSATEANQSNTSDTDSETEEEYDAVNYTADYQYGPDACESGADDDGLNMSQESQYRTNPCANDTDGDGLSDYAEVNRESLSESDPTRMDVFVELDYMEGNRPRSEEVQAVIEAYADSPVDNPDGSTGITLHIVVDDAVPSQNETGVNGVFGAMEAHFDHEGDGYRYGLVVNDAVTASPNDAVGFAARNQTGLNGFFVIEKSSPSDDGENTRDTLMHELGHSVGLHKPVYKGIDKTYSPSEYDSAMRYGYRELDYSHGEPFNDWEHIETSMFTPEVTNESVQAMNSSD